jgi:hypothetical protein
MSYTASPYSSARAVSPVRVALSSSGLSPTAGATSPWGAGAAELPMSDILYGYGEWRDVPVRAAPNPNVGDQLRSTMLQAQLAPGTREADDRALSWVAEGDTRQPVVRSTLKTMYDTVQAQGNTIRQLQRTLAQKTEPSDLSALEQQVTLPFGCCTCAKWKCVGSSRESGSRLDAGGSGSTRARGAGTQRRSQPLLSDHATVWGR